MPKRLRMKSKAVSWLSMGCILAAIAAGTIGTANAAIVPFNGTEYSWLHEDTSGSGPGGDWIEQIHDTIPVRNGDVMQFQNRWYNAYAGTTDIRISYGGCAPYSCTGSDEYVFCGLNYGNYYPGGTDTMSAYATVTNCSNETYGISVNHQYVYNGIMYGSGPFGSGLGFREILENETPRYVAGKGPDGNASATATAQPSAAGMPGGTEQPAPAPGLIPGILAILTGTFVIGYFCRRHFHK
jgi:hypothetical protein